MFSGSARNFGAHDFSAETRDDRKVEFAGLGEGGDRAVKDVDVGGANAADGAEHAAHDGLLAGLGAGSEHGVTRDDFEALEQGGDLANHVRASTAFGGPVEADAIAIAEEARATEQGPGAAATDAGANEGGGFSVRVVFMSYNLT